MVSLQDYLILGGILFGLGITGVLLNRRNLITILMCIELILLAVNFNFLAFAHFTRDIAGELFVFFILTVAAAETAIGLAIIVLVYRNRRTIDVADLDTLKG